MFSFPSLRDCLYMFLELLCCIMLAFMWGLYQHHRGMEDAKAAQIVLQNKVTVASDKMTRLVLGNYVPKVQIIQGLTTTIEKKVPIYVTQKDDSGCTIPNSFVGLWNATNKMQLPDDSKGIPTGASSVVLSDVAAQHAREAGIEQQNEARIDAMRIWLLDQQRAYNGK